MLRIEAGLAGRFQSGGKIFLVEQRSPRTLCGIAGDIADAAIVHLPVPEPLVVEPLGTDLAFVRKRIDVIGHKHLCIGIVGVTVLAALLAQCTEWREGELEQDHYQPRLDIHSQEIPWRSRTLRY